jgi:flagellum-specific peptidoglycan hydrolase FlgJ
MYSLAVKNKTKWFIDTYGEGIAKAIKGTNLFFPAVVAQKALESGWGQSYLTTKHNNWGGIKCAPKLDGAIGCIKMDTTEVNKKGVKYRTTQSFTKFSDTASGIKAVTQVLMQPIYANARNNAKTAKEQIIMIAESGYTTTKPKEYLAAMSSIIEAAQDYKGLGRIA